jgi:polysaccharide biosynthesis transport protein
MLQANKPPPAMESDLIAADAAAQAELLAWFMSLVRRQLPVIVSIALLTTTLGMLYVITTPPSYTAQATMIIDTHKVQLFQQQGLFSDPVIDTGLVDSQVEILKSENIAVAVLKKLHLTEDPEFAGRGGIIRALIESVSGLFGSIEPKSPSQLTRRAAQTFANRLTVKRIGLTYVISISFESRDPDRAAQIANAVADAYLADQLEANSRAIQRAGAWLQDRLRELSEQASTAQRAVVDFKAKNNIVNTRTHGQLMDNQRVEEINSELTIARAQTSEARARLDRIQGILSLDAPNVTIDATVADSLKNDVISKLRSQYLDLANREAVWSTRYGRNHLAAEALRDQMREVRNSIVDELRRIAEGYKSDYQIAKQHEEDIQKELVQAVSQSQVTDAAQVVLSELESNAQTYRALYETLLQR